MKTMGEESCKVVLCGYLVTEKESLFFCSSHRGSCSLVEKGVLPLEVDNEGATSSFGAADQSAVDDRMGTPAAATKSEG
ncbi:hypothetical protein ILYODFUR_010330, partial [Ilyodon furcidens]